ncbi:MAG: sigma-70 family RNA polymerase sigma factor, partial [Myxococcales bacterium]|nr:sigma-70 family RNA polymerase sigma factor [Myxococcales bacterium]
IARNVVADHYRRGSGRAAARTVGDEAVDPVAQARGELALGKQPALDPESHEAREQHARLAQWLGAVVRELPPRYREAIELVDFEGLSQREAAERLGLSHSGLKSRVQRGRALLRRALERCCDVELDRRGRVYDFKARSSCSGCDGERSC